MNQLSWLLYLADVSGNFGEFFIISMTISVIAFFIWCIAAATNGGGFSPSEWKGWRKAGLIIVPTFLFSFVFHAMTPSKETVYAIAASEMGEQVLKTPLAGKAEKALESWLDRQITPPKAVE